MLTSGPFGLAGVAVMLLSGMSFTAELAKRAFFAAIFQVAEPLTFLALCGGGCRV